VRATLQATCDCLQPPSGLVAWWPLDETPNPTIPVTIAHDIVGGHDGTTQVGAVGDLGSPQSVAGKVGNAFAFNGSPAYVVVPDGAATLGFGNPGQGLTIDAWVNVRPGDEDGVLPIVDKRVEVGGKVFGYQLFLFDGKVGLQLADGVGNSVICDTNPAAAPSTSTSCTNYVSTANVADGQWHFVAATVERTGASPSVALYADGALKLTGPTRIHPNTNVSVLIGRNNPTVSFAGDFFKGAIDELELFDRALTPTEIQSLFDAQSAGKCR